MEVDDDEPVPDESDAETHQPTVEELVEGGEGYLQVLEVLIETEPEGARKAAEDFREKLERALPPLSIDALLERTRDVLWAAPEPEARAMINGSLIPLVRAVKERYPAKRT